MLKSGDSAARYRDSFSRSLAGELIAEQCLARAIIVIFLCYIEPPAYSKEQVLQYAGRKQKIARFRATQSEFIK